MTGAEAIPIALKVGAVAVQRMAPTGLSLIKSLFRGKEILVLGQPRAGKTTFVEYLQYGLFEDERHTHKTTDQTATPRFNVKLGRDQSLELIVKSAIDIPGQWGPVQHADVAFERNPHAIVLMLDATSPTGRKNEASASTWLTDFCKRLERNWQEEESKRSKLKLLVILMNKVDKVTNEQTETLREVLAEIAESKLNRARAKMKEDTSVIPCCGVTNVEGTKYLDSAIAHIAKHLAK
ncbi:GTPase domain-containing protein [Variovorax sp. LT2P21]|uniref:GTPase domain-containing protein n=1 Tax=Variovorax sp. LT2P21 TaxID=3443731 RepID=UPI003F48EA1B